MNAVSMNDLWNYLQGLSLTASNQRGWLKGCWKARRKRSSIDSMPKKLIFPKIEKDFKVSQEVFDMVCGTLPEDFGLHKEMEIMWEEMAQ